MKPSAGIPERVQAGANLYSLRRDGGVWPLVFEGRCAVLAECKGLVYVASLLRDPPAQALSAMALAARVDPCFRRPGRPVAAELAVVQERSLGAEDLETRRAFRRRKLELEAVLEDPEEIEPVKAEAEEELATIAQWETRTALRSTDQGARLQDAMRKAIGRFCRNLERATDHTGAPHPVLRPFAKHLWQYLLLPSGRGLGRGGLREAGMLGQWIYCPPPGVCWV